MDIPFLQKRILERAKKREEDDFNDILRSINNSHISGLRFQVWDVDIPLSYFLWSLWDNTNQWTFTSNILELRDKKRWIYEKLETDNLLKNLEHIQDFMDRRLDGFDD